MSDALSLGLPVGVLPGGPGLVWAIMGDNNADEMATMAAMKSRLLMPCTSGELLELKPHNIPRSSHILEAPSIATLSLAFTGLGLKDFPVTGFS